LAFIIAAPFGLIFSPAALGRLRSVVLQPVIGFFPIGWIVLNVIFMYRLTVTTGAFGTLQQAIGGVTPDRRLQVLLIAFAFGAFFEGASGFGTPVAVTAAVLIWLGFSPLAASGLSEDTASGPTSITVLAGAADRSRSRMRGRHFRFICRCCRAARPPISINSISSDAAIGRCSTGCNRDQTPLSRCVGHRPPLSRPRLTYKPAFPG